MGCSDFEGTCKFGRYIQHVVLTGMSKFKGQIDLNNLVNHLISQLLEKYLKHKCLNISFITTIMTLFPYVHL